MCEKEITESHVKYLTLLFDRLILTVRNLTDENHSRKDLTAYFDLGSICENLRQNINETNDFLEEEYGNEEEGQKEEDQDQDSDECTERFIKMSEIEKFINGFKK